MASKVDVVSATSLPEFELRRKSVGKGREWAAECIMPCAGKKMPRDGDVGLAMWPLASG